MQCEGKVKHRDKATARRVFKHLARNQRRVAPALTYYQCPRCGFWHLGNLMAVRRRQ
jgi:hypothetical protein